MKRNFYINKYYIPALDSSNYKKVLSLFVYLSLLFGKLFGKITYKIYTSIGISTGIVLSNQTVI